MAFTCQTCAKRKVKCDKANPICSSCRRGKLECSYQPPPPRWRKRKLDDDVDVLARLARYEVILQKHGLLEAADDAQSMVVAKGEPLQEPISLHWNEPAASGTGKLLAGQGTTRYIDSSLWRNLGDDQTHPLSDDDGNGSDNFEERQLAASGISGGPGYASDPLTEAFVGSQQLENLVRYHPTHALAIALWETYVENVEPICKVLHIPSTFEMIKTASQHPETVSKSNECLIFAVYHFAVFSMTDEDCLKKSGQSRAVLLQRYQLVTSQALVKASFLRTTDMSVLQALVLFLIPCRQFYDSHTYWILTGVAVRIGQRLGLHRDGEKLGLPPFDVQMRRRLFFQLLPLDGNASQVSGAGFSVLPDSWDTKQPLNIDDDQIWPGMTETPEEKKGATDMIFCLSRSTIGRIFAKAGKPASNGSGSAKFKHYNEAELTIREAEKEMEEKYIRYCDVVNPLHFLVMGLARSGITAMRLRIRLPRVRNQTATDAEMRELLQLAQKILDTDAAAYSHAGLIRKFRWHIKPFFLWGMWDSLILILTTLANRCDLLSPAENDAAWNRIEQLYQNHDELLDPKRALHVAFGRLALKAFDVRSSTDVPEPGFIATLRSLPKIISQNRRKGEMGRDNDANQMDPKGDALLSGDLLVPSNAILSDLLPEDFGIGTGNDFDLDAENWISWDQLIQDHQAQGS
ncbi:fungal-specific transcription factor domain-containing protein [Lasiosphaeria miniovina]|uniref:Fungal-specific transcription factor domain-containing protein n=1 Tax=Lasiosphaeria miniovina TaxID=1954250 RepID=A0AA40E1X2_9PEZI|nr:fungal-specific transcription factor domain-containing protein [Lasiosphaeria miniovina]KAK0721942.1 fungal-specific transcription factor domain-containing protein [Lasiosphaeria miniovina]